MLFIDHAEKFLGKIDKGWKDNNSNVDLRILLFRDCPSENVSTYLSLGMSNQILELSPSKKVRQELVLSVYSLSISDMIVSFLMSLCEAILGRGKAVLRGEVIPLSTELAKRIGFEAVYCTIPVFFDDQFYSYDEISPSTVIVWVVPIYQSESDYIKKNGWERFEDMLEEKDPDLCSLRREPVV